MSPPEFQDLYNRLRSEIRPAVVEQSDEPRITLSADQMPLETFARYISNQSRVSIVIDQAIDQLPVTMDILDEPVGQVLTLAGRRLGVQIARHGNTYYIGTLKPEDRGVLVRKVSRLDSVGLEQALGVLKSDMGRVAIYPDGVIVLGDRADVIQRVTELLDQLESAPVDVWVVQLYMISINKAATKDFGFDVAPALDLAYTFSLASGTLGSTGGLLTGSSLTGGFDALLRAAASNERLRLTSAPMFLLLDGRKARFADARKQPIPMRTVSSEGTVTTTGYQFVDVGLTVEVGVRDLGQDRGQLDVDLSLSSLVGMVEDAPITTGQTFQTSAVCHSGGVYLLGTMEQRQTSHKVSGPMQLAMRDDLSESVVQIWARLYRVAGSTITPSEDMSDGKDSDQ